VADSFDNEVEEFFTGLPAVLAAAPADIESQARAWRGALADANLVGFGIPEEFGGRTDVPGASRRFQELSRGRVPGVDSVFGIGLSMAVPTMIQFGSREQCLQFIPPALRGEHVWCQLYSEPGAGSDLSSLRTTAVLDGDEWIVNGQKVWTSGAHHSDYGILLARTGDEPRHKGISMLIMPMRQPGVDVRPLRQMTGEAEFNEVFFTDARVPKDWVIGAVNDGWRAATGLLAHERSSLGSVSSDEKREASGSAALPVHYLLEVAARSGTNAHAVVRQQLASLYTGEKLMEWGGQRRVHPSIGKLWRTKQARAAAVVASHIALGFNTAHETDDADGEFWMYHILNAPRMSLGGGTDEIQKNTLGERALGLPREPQ
jgi:alkylation response protein AidB-like acyl-CoA dehydrogenase